MRKAVDDDKTSVARRSFEAKIVISCKNLRSWLPGRSPRDFSQEGLMDGQVCFLIYKSTFFDNDRFSGSNKIGNVVRRSQLLRKLALRQKDFYVIPFVGLT
jgi:hypothetical protein